MTPTTPDEPTNDFPLIVGSGKRLFEGKGSLKRMRLVDTKTTKSGASILTYQPA